MPLCGLGDAVSLRGYSVQALRCYDEAYELDNENVLILNNKAAVYFAQKDYAKCIEVRTGVGVRKHTGNGPV